MYSTREKSRVVFEKLLDDLITFGVYMIILYFVVLTNKDSIQYINKQHFENMFIKGRYVENSVSFEDINSRVRFVLHLKQMFVVARKGCAVVQ